jgi:toxin-antitoxin system PIN domain toxin
VILLDVGVWLAAIWGRHAHHPRVAQWFSSQTDDLAFCRVTRMSVLRLLTNGAVMGPDVVSRAAAWQVLDQLRQDDRVIDAEEPAYLEPVWRVISAGHDKSHKLWTDDYLAAFAQSAGVPLATLDKGMARRYPSTTVETLN